MAEHPVGVVPYQQLLERPPQRGIIAALWH
jgi:hypothetical protein